MIIRSIAYIHLSEAFGESYPMHVKAREYCGLVLGLPGGATDVYINEKKYEFREGDVAFFRQGNKYDVALPFNHMLCYVINFLADDVDDFFILKGCGDLTDSFKQAHRLWMRRREDEYFRYDCISILYRLLAEIRRRYDRGQPPYRIKSKLTPLIDILHDEYRNPDFRISELSVRTGFSQRYICHLFQECCGMSPKQYLTDLRFRHAKELLKDGWSSIALIAERAGFSDASRFSDSFRKAFGVTPGEYRRESGEAE